MDQHISERSIFESAIDKGSLEERVAYLDQACGNNAALRQEVEALLAAHDRLGSLLPVARGPSPMLPLNLVKIAPLEPTIAAA